LVVILTHDSTLPRGTDSAACYTRNLTYDIFKKN